MKYFFCLISNKDTNAVNIGKTFVYKNRAKWVEVPGEEFCKYLTAGYVKGIDHVVYQNKAYMIMKSYMDLEEHFVVMACVESISGCDI